MIGTGKPTLDDSIERHIRLEARVMNKRRKMLATSVSDGYIYNMNDFSHQYMTVNDISHNINENQYNRLKHLNRFFFQFIM